MSVIFIRLFPASRMVLVFGECAGRGFRLFRGGAESVVALPWPVVDTSHDFHRGEQTRRRVRGWRGSDLRASCERKFFAMPDAWN